MVAHALHNNRNNRSGPFGLVVSGEAGEFADALSLIVGPRWLETYKVDSDGEVIHLVQAGLIDAVVLDEAVAEIDVLALLRMIRFLNESLLVVLLATRVDRRRLAEALRLAAFSVITKPLGLEELLAQIHRMMVRLETTIRTDRL
ncbi:MAG: response regulator [Planctomycetota bacterium]|nr:response regulator [Planctomycetota bacterium]